MMGVACINMPAAMRSRALALSSPLSVLNAINVAVMSSTTTSM